MFKILGVILMLVGTGLIIDAFKTNNRCKPDCLVGDDGNKYFVAGITFFLSGITLMFL